MFKNLKNKTVGPPMNWVIAWRLSYTGLQSMQLKINEKIKSMQITYIVVTKDSTGDNTDLNLN